MNTYVYEVWEKQNFGRTQFRNFSAQMAKSVEDVEKNLFTVADEMTEKSPKYTELCSIFSLQPNDIIGYSIWRVMDNSFSLKEIGQRLNNRPFDFIQTYCQLELVG